MFEGIRLDSNGAVSFRDLSGQPTHSMCAEKQLSFEEIVNLEFTNLQNVVENTFFNVYTQHRRLYIAQNGSEALRQALPTDYNLFNFPNKQQFEEEVAVFYKNGNKLELLWRPNRNATSGTPAFFDELSLRQELKKVFSNITSLKLGKLQEKKVRYIAWEVIAEKKFYYIPLHNGLICPKEEEWVFDNFDKEFRPTIYKEYTEKERKRKELEEQTRLSQEQNQEKYPSSQKNISKIEKPFTKFVETPQMPEEEYKEEYKVRKKNLFNKYKTSEFQTPSILDLEALANEEFNRISKFIKNKFFSVYKTDGCAFFTQTSTETLRVSLSAQDYICSSMVKRMQIANNCGVFYIKNKKLHCLWTQNRYQEAKRPVYLNVHSLTKELKKIFSNIKSIKLGRLRERIDLIAWEIQAEQGVFYLFWHNGLICRKEEDWEFEEKKFEALRSTYKVLRFAKTDTQNEYKIVCG